MTSSRQVSTASLVHSEAGCAGTHVRTPEEVGVIGRPYLVDDSDPNVGGVGGSSLPDQSDKG